MSNDYECLSMMINDNYFVPDDYLSYGIWLE